MAEEYEIVQKSSVKGRLKFLFKDSVLYGGVSSVSKFLHIILLPILTRLISKEDYGVYDTLLIISNLALIIIIAGTDSSVARFFYDTKNKKKQKELVSQTLFLEILISVGICFILWAISKIVLNFYFESIYYLSELRILIITLPFIALVRFTQNLLKWVFKRKEFLIVSSGSILLSLMLSITSITLISAEIKYLFYSQLASMATFSMLGLYFIKSYLKFPTSFKTLIPQFKFGLPFTANQFMSSLIPAIERYFISAFLGLSYLGIYAVGNKLSQLSQLAINGFQVAWGPLVYSIMNETNAYKTYKKIYNYYIIFIALFILIFSALTPLLINYLATAEYSSAVYIIFMLLLSKLFRSISGISAIGIELSKKTYLKVISSIFQLLLTGGFIYLFMTFWGISGVALGVLSGNIIYVIITNYFAFKVYDLRFSFIYPVILMAISVLMSAYILYSNSMLITLFATPIGLLILCIFFCIFIIDKNDTALLNRKIRSLCRF